MYALPASSMLPRRPIRIVSVAGTRPEAIKLAPIALEIARRSYIEHILIATGQHGALFDDALNSFGIVSDRRIETRWDCGNRDTTAAAIASAFQQCRPDIVLVQGDTDTALVAAQSAASLGVPVGHVEAGLRTFDPASPFPEEQNRVGIARLATLHFAPGKQAAINLEREGICTGVHITGNTGIDALMMRSADLRPADARGPVLVTCHRRENFGVPLARICSALRNLADQGVPLLVPLHSNPNSADTMRAALSGHSCISLVAPLPYSELIATIRNARFVITDSGGLQEECAALGTPLILLRDNTERPEVVDSGNCVLVGSDPDAIIALGLLLARDAAYRAKMATPTFPYGRGQAAAKILDAIIAWRNGS